MSHAYQMTKNELKTDSTNHQELFLEKVFPNFPKFFQKFFSKNLEKLEKLEKFGKTFLEKFGKILENLEKHFSKNSPCLNDINLESMTVLYCYMLRIDIVEIGHVLFRLTPQSNVLSHVISSYRVRLCMV